MSIAWRAGAAGLEAAIALCAALNATYFLGRAMSSRPLSRRAAALVLAMMSLGTLAESIVVLVSLQLRLDDSVFATALWIVARGISFAGTGCISVLVLRGRK